MLPPIQSPADLQTSHEATCRGFLDQAKVKAERATPYVEKAQLFWEELRKCNAPSDVLTNPRLEEDLVSTAGVSAKARQYLNVEDIQRILSGIIDGIPDARKDHFREEVFYRYLLCRGASLDGEMRNFTGAEAARLLVAKLLDELQVRHDPSVWFKDRRTPEKLPEAKAIAESHKVQKIAWHNRVLVFDRTPRLIKKNVDVILLDASMPLSDKDLLAKHAHYLACGELKGGIDPAGADEHWKTAKSAIDRVQKAFARQPKKPALFFVAAAIEEAMAVELFEWLQTEKLAYAANLTVPLQVAKLVSWLVSL